MGLDFIDGFDALCGTHGLELQDALEAIAEVVQRSADQQTHATVKSLLESAAQQLRHAALDIYASTK